MIVSNLLSKLPLPFATRQTAPHADRAATATEKPLPVASSPVTAPVNARLQELLAGYDVRQISPRELSELAQSLHAAGAISDSDFQILGRIRLELDLGKLDPDERIDLVDILQQKLTQQEEKFRELEQKSARAGGAPPDRDAYLSVARQQLDLLRKFVTAQTTAAESTFDAVA